MRKNTLNFKEIFLRHTGNDNLIMTINQIYRFFKLSKTKGRRVKGFVSPIMKDRLYVDSSCVDADIYLGGSII